MDRKEFLALVGLGGAAVLASTMVAGCTKKDSGAVPAPTNVNFTLDLTLPANAALASPGGFVYSNGLIVARTAAGQYIAVSQACTHQGVTVQYTTQGGQFFCPSHGAVFTETGAVVSGPAPAALAKYNSALTGGILRVFS